MDRVAGVVYLLIVLLVLSGCGPKKESNSLSFSGYNLIIISVDALRADHLGTYGYAKETSTFIDSVAKEGVLFENAIVPVPKTGRSLFAMNTGLYPYKNPLFNFNQKRAEAYTLPSVLKQNGYTTVAFVSNWVLRAPLFKISRYYDFYDYDFTTSELNRPNFFERNAEETNLKVFDWLGKNSDEKFFMWVHYIDPHGPYFPPEKYRSVFNHSREKFVTVDKISSYQQLPHIKAEGNMIDLNSYIDQYDNEIYYTDKNIKDLFSKLEQMDLLEKSIVILTADHGESLGQHDYYLEHGREVYDDCARIPLIIRFPGKHKLQGKRVKSLVSNMDIFPTVLSLLGLKSTPSADIDGVDFSPLLGGAEETRPFLFIENHRHKKHKRKFAIRTTNEKLIKKVSGYEFYDLVFDKHEENKKKPDKARFQELDEKLRAFVQQVFNAKNVKRESQVLNAKDIRILKSLGYAE